MLTLILNNCQNKGFQKDFKKSRTELWRLNIELFTFFFFRFFFSFFGFFLGFFLDAFLSAPLHFLLFFPTQKIFLHFFSILHLYNLDLKFAERFMLSVKSFTISFFVNFIFTISFLLRFRFCLKILILLNYLKVT